MLQKLEILQFCNVNEGNKRTIIMPPRKQGDLVNIRREVIDIASSQRNTDTNYLPYEELGPGAWEFTGTTAYSNLGYSVSSAGDVNGDGYNDFLIGAPFSGTGSIGETYLAFGQNTPLSSGSNNAKTVLFQGAFYLNFAGLSVSGAGDVNNDGFADLLIGAPGSFVETSTEAGKAYLVFGQQDWSQVQNVSLSSLNNQSIPQGIRFLGPENDFAGAGYSVSNAGDVNNDGISDFLIAAPGASAPASAAGKVYLIFGQTQDAWNQLSDVSLEALSLESNSNPQGVVFSGTIEGTEAGVSVSNAGDVNGDSIDDFLIGVPFTQVESVSEAGKTYIVFGQGNWSNNYTFPLSLLGSNSSPRGIVLEGPGGSLGYFGSGAGSQTGYCVSGAGDVNNDGFDDVLIGAPSAGLGAHHQSGKAYLVFGQAAWNGNGTFYLGALGHDNDLQNIVFSGSLNDNSLGWSVSNAGDVDNDGFGDFLIGSPFAFESLTTESGRAYLIFGQEDWSTVKHFSIGNLNNSSVPHGLIFEGTSLGSYLGKALANAGDVNGDGIADFLIGSPQAGAPKPPYDTGAAYLLLGRELWNGTSTILLGNRAGNTTQANLLPRKALGRRLLSFENDCVENQLLITTVPSASRLSHGSIVLPARLSTYQYTEACWQAFRTQYAAIAVNAARHGAIQGIAEVVQEAGYQRGHSGNYSHYAYAAAYYSLWFATRLMTHWQQSQAEGNPEEYNTLMHLTKAGVNAAADTANLAIANTMINSACRLARWAGEKSEQLSWTQTGKTLKWVGQHGRAVIFAKDSLTQGITKTGISMASGIAARETTSCIGKAALNFLFWKKPKQQTNDNNSVKIRTDSAQLRHSNL